jgi:hypothetical protein
MDKKINRQVTWVIAITIAVMIFMAVLLLTS